MNILYPNLLKDAVDAGHITRRQAYDFLLEHGVYPCKAMEMLGEYAPVDTDDSPDV
jgi:hypothetical protein